MEIIVLILAISTVNLVRPERTCSRGNSWGARAGGQPPVWKSWPGNGCPSLSFMTSATQVPTPFSRCQREPLPKTSLSKLWSKEVSKPWRTATDSKQTFYLSALDFWRSPVWNFEFDELDFFPSLNWIFAGYTGSKNPVQTRKKIQFIKIEISNWRISKIQCR